MKKNHKEKLFASQEAMLVSKKQQAKKTQERISIFSYSKQERSRGYILFHQCDATFTSLFSLKTYTCFLVLTDNK